MLEQSFTSANIPSDLHTFLPDLSAAVTAQFNFDPVDMPSLPALMSPGSSMNEFSESVDGHEEEEDDDDLDEYEIFAPPCRRTSADDSHANNSNANANGKQYQLECSERSSMSFDSGLPFLPFQHPFHNHYHYALPNACSPMYSEFQQPHMMCHQQQSQQHALIPEAQRLQSLPVQHQHQQQSMCASNFIQHLQQPFLSSSAHLHAVPTISVEQVPNPQDYVETGVLNYYLSSLETQQQSSLLSTLENSLDILLTPNISNVSSISNSSFAQSPTMSWVSTESSRPASPEHQHRYQQQQEAFPIHVAVSQNNSNNKRPRPTKKRSVPLYRKAKYIATERHASTTAEGDLPASLATATVASEDSTCIKRKRRARQTKPKVKPTSFSCDVPDCGKVFSRAYNLTSHMKTHSAERPFLCGSCPLAFARRHDRERHVRLHTGEKPYNCQSCGNGFMRNDALHRHQRICGQSALALAALLHQNGGIGQKDAAAAASLEGLDATSVYQNIFEL
ncbi:hypothetical protein BGZ96_005868 [Linnemannia gamsii]|uniref:C2H2-type domain-containing protein n=1 Tax=Linnemannia gamsii TaxID=64522 RepID=A0ABQ7KEM8_9FUNG|nr:hypothetical protein BGZ96_005868 [Linnemannia gamsii]